MIYLALFCYLVYFANVGLSVSIENCYEKLAVVSDLSRSLVYRPIPNYYWMWAFFCKERHMLYFLRKLFCIHTYEFDYDDERGYTQECRKCGKDD